MPDNTKPTSGKKIGISAVYLIIALIVFIPSVPYQWFAESRAAEADKPKLYANTIVKAFREFRERRGVWPQNLQELSDAKVWSTIGDVQVGEDGRNMVVSNYYYRYFSLPGDAIGLWAVPVGKDVETGSTHYLLVGLLDMRHWIGPPLKKEDAKLIVPFPTPAQFAMLLLKEQLAVVEKPVVKKRGIFGR